MYQPGEGDVLPHERKTQSDREAELRDEGGQRTSEKRGPRGRGEVGGGREVNGVKVEGKVVAMVEAADVIEEGVVEKGESPAEPEPISAGGWQRVARAGAYRLYIAALRAMKLAKLRSPNLTCLDEIQLPSHALIAARRLEP